LTRYSDGKIITIPTTRIRLPLAAVSRAYEDQNFSLVLLNRGGNLITVFFQPLLQPEEPFEVPPSSPGIILDGIPFEKLANGIDAIASTGATDLQVNLYSNDISYKEKVSLGGIPVTSYPRDTYNYG